MHHHDPKFKLPLTRVNFSLIFPKSTTAAIRHESSLQTISQLIKCDKSAPSTASSSSSLYQPQPRKLSLLTEQLKNKQHATNAIITATLSTKTHSHSPHSRCKCIFPLLLTSSYNYLLNDGSVMKLPSTR